MYQTALKLMILWSVVLPFHLKGQSETTDSWQEVITTSIEGPNKDLKTNINKKRPLVKKDRSMSKIFNGFIKRPEVLSFKVCINKGGKVTFVEVREDQTTIKKANILRQALNSLRKYQFQPDATASGEECGVYEIIVK